MRTLFFSVQCSIRPKVVLWICHSKRRTAPICCFIDEYLQMSSWNDRFPTIDHRTRSTTSLQRTICAFFVISCSSIIITQSESSHNLAYAYSHLYYLIVYFFSFLLQMCSEIPKSLINSDMEEMRFQSAQLSIKYVLETLIHSKEKVRCVCVCFFRLKLVLSF